MDQREKAIDFLSIDRLLHIDMLETIRRGHARLLHVTDRGVLLYHVPGDTWMMSAEDPATADEMLAFLARLKKSGRPGGEEPDGPTLLVAHQDHYLEQAQSLLGLPFRMACRQSAYLEKTPLPEPAGAGEIRQLGPEHLSEVHRHYSNPVGLPYLRERLEAGVFHGVFIDGQLAGFAGVHAEGSLGMLEVLPGFRRQGVATRLQAFMTNWHLSLGYTPFAQIKVGNESSLALQRKVGYAVSEKEVTWLMDE